MPMPLDDDADEDVGGARPPLPPDDRLWRHPSELGAFGLTAGAVAAAADDRTERPSTWAVVLVAGLAGAVLASGLIALTGSLSSRVVERPVVEKVAISPIVSAPMLPSDHGVQAVARRLGPAIVRLDVARGSEQATGSGVLFRDDGMLLTSAHVVEDADRIDVRLADGRRFEGTLVGVDDPTDVAVVDVDATNLPVAVLGSTKDLAVGAPAMAIGSPVGADGGTAVSTGVISALGRTAQAEDGTALHGLLQTDAPIAAGSTGGALVDTAGSVVGIVSSVAAEVAGRFGFATPIDLAHRIALQLISHGKAVMGWLGVQATDISPDQATQIGVPGGAKVQGVTSHSPAERAGLTRDDVITEVDGKPVGSMPGLMVELREHEPGDEVSVGYWRDGQQDQTDVTLGEHP
jgi:S1-C subfamily serine protease